MTNSHESLQSSWLANSRQRQHIAVPLILQFLIGFSIAITFNVSTPDSSSLPSQPISIA